MFLLFLNFFVQRRLAPRPDLDVEVYNEEAVLKEPLLGIGMLTDLTDINGRIGGEMYSDSRNGATPSFFHKCATPFP